MAREPHVLFFPHLAPFYTFLKSHDLERTRMAMIRSACSPGVSEGRWDLLAETAAEGEPGRGDPACRRDGGPEESAEGAERPAEGARAGRDQPEGVLLHQDAGAGALRGRTAGHAGRGADSTQTQPL